jgi:sedoheptulokinase
VYDLLNALGAAAQESGAGAGLVVSPSLLAERHDPSLRARIEGIEPGNMGLGALAWALAQGIVRNLRDMMPADTLSGRTAVVGTGNALRRNIVLRRAAEAVFRLDLIVPESREEAAVGAAVVTSRLARQNA